LPSFHTDWWTVHSRAVVADDRLRHERRGLAIGLRDVPDRVLQDLQPVGALDQRLELRADLALAGVGDFVVMDFDVDPLGDHHLAHFRADVLERIDRRHGK
jgi:hypothetical protein